LIKITSVRKCHKENDFSAQLETVNIISSVKKHYLSFRGILLNLFCCLIYYACFLIEAND